MRSKQRRKQPPGGVTSNLMRIRWMAVKQWHTPEVCWKVIQGPHFSCWLPPQQSKPTQRQTLTVIIVFRVCLLQLQRYKELKELAHKQGAILSQQAEKLNWEVRADYEKIAYDHRRKKEVEVLSSDTQWIYSITDIILNPSINFFLAAWFSGNRTVIYLLSDTWLSCGRLHVLMLL